MPRTGFYLLGSQLFLNAHLTLLIAIRQDFLLAVPFLVKLGPQSRICIIVVPLCLPHCAVVEEEARIPQENVRGSMWFDSSHFPHSAVELQYVQRLNRELAPFLLESF